MSAGNVSDLSLSIRFPGTKSWFLYLKLTEKEEACGLHLTYRTISLVCSGSLVNNVFVNVIS
jgi:hypothetical protein